jgi:hypothetical protein
MLNLALEWGFWAKRVEKAARYTGQVPSGLFPFSAAVKRSGGSKNPEGGKVCKKV